MKSSSRWNYILALALIAVAVVPWRSVPLPLFDKQPVDAVIVIEESKNRTPEVANVIGGKTAQMLRAAGVWSLFDGDSIGTEYTAAVGTPPSLPWCVFIRDEKTAWSGPLPKTDAEFAARLAKEGGIK